MKNNISLTRAMDSAFGVRPTEVSGIGNISYAYYTQLLLRKIKGIIRIECPDTWDKDFLTTSLIQYGVFCVTTFDSEPIGIDCQPYGISMYYRPTDVNIANPVISKLYGGPVKRTIGEDSNLFISRKLEELRVLLISTF